MRSQKSTLLIIGCFAVCCLAILLLAFKGKSGGAYQSFTAGRLDGSITGPFESSNSTSRYILAKTIALRQQLTFNEQEARSAAPDLVYYNDRFQSIFMPGVAFLAVPLLWLGAQFGQPQVGAYLTTSLLAISNTVLVVLLSRKLAANWTSALLAGCVFLFGSNAFVYAQTLTQHHPTITVLLLSVWLMFGSISWRRMIAFGGLVGIAFLFDFPNLLLLLPVGIFFLTRAVTQSEHAGRYVFEIRLAILGIIIGLLPLLAVLGWYNWAVTGSPYKLGQFLGRTNIFDSAEKRRLDQLAADEAARNPYEPKLPFQTRIQQQGVYVLLFGQERSWTYYSPVLWIGVLGLWQAFRQERRQAIVVTLFSIIVINILIYSMFGDPWGGWSFGPRYLLPATALMAVFVGLALSYYRRWWLTLLFAATISYSVVISTLGATTSAAIPPKQEAERLERYLPYTYAYNWGLLDANLAGSYVYNVWLQAELTARQYYYLVVAASLTPVAALLLIRHRPRHSLTHWWPVRRDQRKPESRENE